MTKRSAEDLLLAIVTFHPGPLCPLCGKTPCREGTKRCPMPAARKFFERDPRKQGQCSYLREFDGILHYCIKRAGHDADRKSVSHTFLVGGVEREWADRTRRPQS